MKSLRDWAVFILRLFLGGILVYAGWMKLQAFSGWREAVTKMDLLPIDWVGPAAAALPGIEFVVGLALVTGFWRRAAALVSTLLFLFFAAVLALLLHRNLPATCSCFGPDDLVPIDRGQVVLRLLGAALAALSTGEKPTLFELETRLLAGRRDK